MKDNNKDKLQDMRHSAAHLLAAAVVKLYPDTKLGIGPAIENGFYYDFQFSKPISEEDLPKIEEEMRKLLPSWTHFSHRVVSIDEAKKIYANNPFKLELVEQLALQGVALQAYKSGGFEDLCRGGHNENPSRDIVAFKLLSIAGAYWRGSEKNPMLTRIYGTAFPTKEELDQHLHILEEAKKRDHRKLGKELDLFVYSDLVGKGLPLFTPKGTILRDVLNDYSQKLRLEKGFQKVWIPHIAKDELYKKSGHWDKFGNELFLVKSQETEDNLILKPMNCPHHQQLYASRPRSYKELPIKYLETTTIYRDEKAGELMGLSRVRAVTQDDSHTFCTPEQIKEVYHMLIGIVKDFYNALGMQHKARLSFRDPQTPEKYLGEQKLWEQAQKIIEEVAKENKLDYFIAIGEAAFYGPKIDFMVMDALGREWQLATPQLDFVQPKRFGLTYIDAKGKEQTPVMIHFALMGSLERFLSVYIEHTAGKFPVWLSPVQITIIPIADRHIEHARRIHDELIANNIRSIIDDRPESMQAKIRDATLQKVPFMGIIGDKEMASNDNAISIRTRDGKDEGIVSLSRFLQRVKENIDKKT